MSARVIVAQHLSTQLPSARYKVIPHPTDPDGVKDCTVLVWREQLERGAVLGTRSNDVTVWLLTGQQDPRKAEDALDAALDEVTAAMDELDSLSWSTAERGTYGDTFNGYRITVTVHTTKE